MSPTSSAEQYPVPAAPSLHHQSAIPVTDHRGDGEGGSRPRSPAVHTIGLRKEFRQTIALESMSMTVGRGEVFGFLGPNGAGKTTAIKLLMGLVRPTAGEAMVLGAPAGDVETRRRIGYLPELFRYQNWLSAEEVLLLHCRLLQLTKARWPSAVSDALATVGLSGRRGDKVGTFSKGMQQRLGLGVALLGQPELILLDEPTSALDPVGRHEVREIIKGLRERGASVFLNTHLLDEVEHICDRVAVIDKGRTVATGTLAELVGQQSSVRIKVAGLGERWWMRFGGFGNWSDEGDWLLVESINPSQVPVLVRAIVEMGGEVAAVVPEHKSLEARFLELLGSR